MRLGPRYGTVGQPQSLARLGVSRSAAPSGPTNIVDPAGWGNASAGSVSADGSGNITFTAAGNGVNISEVPRVALKPNTLYDWSVSWDGLSNKVNLKYGGLSNIAFGIQAGATSGQFTTGADVGDGKLYVNRNGLGSVSGTVSLLTISQH